MSKIHQKAREDARFPSVTKVQWKFYWCLQLNLSKRKSHGVDKSDGFFRQTSFPTAALLFLISEPQC